MAMEDSMPVCSFVEEELARLKIFDPKVFLCKASYLSPTVTLCKIEQLKQ